jgi:hypothetical protein
VIILGHVDPLLGGDRETGDCTMDVARQRPARNNRGKVFYVQSVLRCYKQDSLSNELVVRQSPADKNVSTEAENIFGSVARQRLVTTQQTEKTSYTWCNELQSV